MRLILLISLLLINGCAPLLNAGGLIHSVFTNNTINTFLGLGDFAIKEKTGKSTGSHLLYNFNVNNDLRTNNKKEINKDLKWDFK